MPDQLPGDAVNVCPTRAVPLIVGADVFTGGEGAARTAAVFALDADADPAEFVAATTTRNAEPRSARTGLYLLCDAPPMVAHLPREQRRHRYA